MIDCRYRVSEVLHQFLKIHSQIIGGGSHIKKRNSYLPKKNIQKLSSIVILIYSLLECIKY